MSSIAWMPGPQEWLIIAVVALLLFGAKRLPEVGRSVGRAINEFKKGLRESPPEGEEHQESSDSDEDRAG